MATFSERLKKLRKEKKLTQEELANMLNVGVSTISMYETGKSTPNDEIKKKLADIFDVSIDYLIGRSDIRKPDAYNVLDAIPVGKLLQIPVIGTVKAGEGGIAYEELLGYEYIDADMVKDCENCFFLRVKGDSMEPLIMEGDLALVRRQPDVPSNSLAVVIINGEEGMIKKLVKKEDTIVLQSLNPKYEPIIIKNDDFNIVGQVISILRKFV